MQEDNDVLSLSEEEEASQPIVAVPQLKASVVNAKAPPKTSSENKVVAGNVNVPAEQSVNHYCFQGDETFRMPQRFDPRKLLYV